MALNEIEKSETKTVKCVFTLHYIYTHTGRVLNVWALMWFMLSGCFLANCLHNMYMEILFFSIGILMILYQAIISAFPCKCGNNILPIQNRYKKEEFIYFFLTIVFPATLPLAAALSSESIKYFADWNWLLIPALLALQGAWYSFLGTSGLAQKFIERRSYSSLREEELLYYSQNELQELIFWQLASGEVKKADKTSKIMLSLAEKEQLHELL